MVVEFSNGEDPPKENLSTTDDSLRLLVRSNLAYSKVFSVLVDL
jgi:hypothetical protein